MSPNNKPWEPPPQTQPHPHNQISIHDIISMYIAIGGIVGEPTPGRTKILEDFEKIIGNFTSTLSFGATINGQR